MFSHVTVGANDFDALVVFYDAMFAPLGAARFFDDRELSVAGWRAHEGAPAFYVGRPFDRAAAHPGNGWMAAFRAADHAAVDAAHAAALAHGGTCAGKPGLRPQYAPDYYGAYMRDPEGNKLHVVHRTQWGVLS